jgi:hypothetical protein
VRKAVLRIRLGVLVDLDVVYQPQDRTFLFVVVERGVLQHRIVVHLEEDQARQLHGWLGAQLELPIALGGVSADE